MKIPSASLFWLQFLVNDVTHEYGWLPSFGLLCKVLVKLQRKALNQEKNERFKNVETDFPAKPL